MNDFIARSELGGSNSLSLNNLHEQFNNDSVYGLWPLELSVWLFHSCYIAMHVELMPGIFALGLFKLTLFLYFISHRPWIMDVIYASYIKKKKNCRVLVRRNGDARTLKWEKISASLVYLVLVIDPFSEFWGIDRSRLHTKPQALKLSSIFFYRRQVDEWRNMTWNEKWVL